MTAIRMHSGEVAIDEGLVRRLLRAQFPDWADLPIERVRSAGTDNAIYRLGEEMAVRLPRIEWAVAQIGKDDHWLARLAPHLPLEIPTVLATGTAGEGYPWPWSVHRWLPGEDAAHARPMDYLQAAKDLADFIRALQAMGITDGPSARENDLRGVPLRMRHPQTRAAIKSLDGLFDIDALSTAWQAALEAPEWDREPVWFHGDLLPGNLLIRDGRLSAVIDFSGIGVGDPACDLMSAWSLFSGESRDEFRRALGMDDATWARGRGHALSQAVIFIPYYLHTNPVGVAVARRAVEEILAEHEEGLWA